MVSLCEKPVFEFARTRYGFQELLECRQAACLTKMERRKGKLVIKRPDQSALTLIKSVYNKLSEEELYKVNELGNLYVGYEDGHMAGFIGSHLEGSIGLLEILPQYRRKGYGAELEEFMIEAMQNKHLLAYGQIETWNQSSMKLQEKLGLTISKEIIYWLF